MTRYRNTEEAFVALLMDIVTDGETVRVRDSETLEIRSQLIEIQRPRERALVIPGRNNNVFAAIAESMWVISGRDDIEFLSGYLKRAKDYSDDGLTWRGAYGPRLRDWNGIDQLGQIIAILKQDPESRRAVATLYDPDRDFVSSKDIPCNNWLHFIARNGQLHLQVAARSTDVWWGFSGINIFEWTLLLEMMAHWLDLAVGNLTFFSSSFHLYERHYAKAQLVLQSDHDQLVSPYGVEPEIAEFATPWATFDQTMTDWMRLEAQLRDGNDIETLTIRFNDPLMVEYIRMIDIWWSFKRGVERAALDLKVKSLGSTDLAFAAAEFLSRQNNHAH